MLIGKYSIMRCQYTPPILIGGSSPVGYFPKTIRLGEWLIRLRQRLLVQITQEKFSNWRRISNENNFHTISLNWAGMVEGPHPVGLSDITGGSNLAAILVSFFTLKLKIFFSQSSTHNIYGKQWPNILISRCCARVTCCLVSQTRWRPPTGRDLQLRVWWRSEMRCNG